MTRAVLACVIALAACKERGTITVDLSLDTCTMAAPTRVLFQAIKGGSCSACSCASCTCDDTSEQQCIRDVPCSGSGCPIEDARANGIEFEPPSAGTYAVTYLFVEGDPAARTVAVICTLVTVDADGTASSTDEGVPTCCM